MTRDELAELTARIAAYEAALVAASAALDASHHAVAAAERDPDAENHSTARKHREHADLDRAFQRACDAARKP